MALSKEWAKVLIQSLEQSGLVGTVRTVWRPAGPIVGNGTGRSGCLRYRHSESLQDSPCGAYIEPDLIRFGFAFLYIRYSDVHEAVSQLREVLEWEEWKADEFSKRGTVT